MSICCRPKSDNDEKRERLALAVQRGIAANRSTYHERALCDRVFEKIRELEDTPLPVASPGERINPTLAPPVHGLHTVDSKLHTDAVIQKGTILGSLEGHVFTLDEYKRLPPPRKSVLEPFSVKVGDNVLAPRIQPGQAHPNPSTCYLFMTDTPTHRNSPNAAFKKMADGSIALVTLATTSPGPIYTGDRQTLSEELIAASMGL